MPWDTALASFHVSSGQTPAKGSAERTAILDAARRYLGFDGKFVVHRLVVSGDRASAHVEAYPAGTSEPAFLSFEENARGDWACVGVDDKAADADTARVLAAQPYTPKSGSSERTAILDAARNYLGYSGKFVVKSMTVLDAVASARIVPEDGSFGEASLDFERRGPDWVCSGYDVASGGAARSSPPVEAPQDPAVEAPQGPAAAWYAPSMLGGTWDYAMAGSQLQYNPFSDTWDFVRSGDQLQYNPFTGGWSYTDPDSRVEYNAFSRVWEWARPGDQLRYNLFTGVWGFTSPAAQVQYSPLAGTWQYVRPGEQLQFNPFTGSWSYAVP